MSSRIRAEVIIARSKRTGEKYPVRASRLASHRRVPFLHYTDNTRLQACRCFEARGHENPFPVSEDDENLAIAITRYMDKFNLESCLQPDFHKNQEQQKVEWALKGVHAERFHYVTRDKKIVCRCSRPDHLYRRRVHSSEIRELCAEFFILETTQTICACDQWRATKVAMRITPRESSISRTSTVGPNSRHINRGNGPFAYDSASVVERLRSRETRSLEPRKHCSWLPSDRKAKPSPSHREDMAHFSTGIDDEADIPEDVWRVSRPSVYLGQCNIDSFASTPIGSSITPVQCSGHPNTMTRRHRPSTLEVGAEAPGVNQYADAWQDVADTDLSESPRSLNSGFPTAPATPTYVAECPFLEGAIELDDSTTQPPLLTHHSPILRELEGGSFEYAAELAAQSPGVPFHASKASHSPPRLTHLIDQIMWNVKLPRQKNFSSSG